MKLLTLQQLLNKWDYEWALQLSTKVSQEKDSLSNGSRQNSNLLIHWRNKELMLQDYWRLSVQLNVNCKTIVVIPVYDVNMERCWWCKYKTKNWKLCNRKKERRLLLSSQSVVYDWTSYCVYCCWISQYRWSLVNTIVFVISRVYKQLRRSAVVFMNSCVGQQLFWSTKNQILCCCSPKDHRLEVSDLFWI